jgi:hypothetical protein
MIYRSICKEFGRSGTGNLKAIPITRKIILTKINFHYVFYGIMRIVTL